MKTMIVDDSFRQLAKVVFSLGATGRILFFSLHLKGRIWICNFFSSASLRLRLRLRPQVVYCCRRRRRKARGKLLSHSKRDTMQKVDDITKSKHKSEHDDDLPFLVGCLATIRSKKKKFKDFCVHDLRDGQIQLLTLDREPRTSAALTFFFVNWIRKLFKRRKTQSSFIHLCWQQRRCPTGEPSYITNTKLFQLFFSGSIFFHSILFFSLESSAETSSERAIDGNFTNEKTFSFVCNFFMHLLFALLVAHEEKRQRRQVSWAFASNMSWNLPFYLLSTSESESRLDDSRESIINF